MPWFFISDALTIGGAAIRSNSHFVTKMVYPVATLPVSEVLSLFFVHLMLMCIIVALFVVSGFGLSVYFLQLPYYLLCSLAFAVVLSMLLSALTAISRDVLQAVKSVITLLFWLTPILWSADNRSTRRSSRSSWPTRSPTSSRATATPSSTSGGSPGLAVHAVLLGASWRSWHCWRASSSRSSSPSSPTCSRRLAVE